MSDPATALSDMQASDYALTGDISLQDYPAFSNDGLAAPTLDSSIGSGGLTVIPYDASGGLNLYNDGLLPLTNPNPTDTSVIALAQGGNVGASVSSSADLTLPGNLPLTAPDKSNTTSLGSVTIKPVAASAPMGASLWAGLFGTAVSAVTGTAKGGVAGATPIKTLPGGVAVAPKSALSTAIATISTSGTVLIGVLVLGVFAIIYAVKK